LQKLIKINSLLSELKSDAIKERHWIKIFKSCRSRERFLPSTLNLGIIWDLDLAANEAALREVIVQAQGEMALEEYLRQVSNHCLYRLIKQVRDTWTNYVLDLVNYQNKCRLVKGWDDLFAKCGENLNSLIAMKFSPYYKAFEEDASHWEDRLNRVHVTFDIWIDVQRQWVYLEGIFAGNADIKQLLPVESSRFQNINSEFLSLMKKVSKSPYVMDVLNIPNLQKSLERLADLLSKIQKALGEYLERERAGFPRFYFVGDEDLLELIGNSRDVVRVQKHFRKMFAGLHSLRLSEDMSTIVGINSKEGETINMLKPISFARNPKINDWLSALEHEMKQTLAVLTADSVREFSTLFNSTFDRPQFVSFLDRYPAQVVLLATQVIWTHSVEGVLSKQNSQSLTDVHNQIEHVLQALAETVLLDLETIQRKKCEHLITEMVHQRDTIGGLLRHSVSSPDNFHWLYQMRFYHIADAEIVDNLVVRMADASFQYGYEYLGVGERLVQTPLTDRCFLTLTQALSQRLGGSPFGPAGTGNNFPRLKLIVEVKRNQSKHWEDSLVGLFWYSVATIPSISKQWPEFSSEYVKLGLGAVSTSSIVWKNAF
jgi:dynein heavy chain 1